MSYSTVNPNCRCRLCITALRVSHDLPMVNRLTERARFDRAVAALRARVDRKWGPR